LLIYYLIYAQTNEDKIATAQQLKEEGNSFVKQQDYGKALLAYHKVSNLLLYTFKSNSSVFICCAGVALREGPGR
jgi:hypothetical protein